MGSTLGLVEAISGLLHDIGKVLQRVAIGSEQLTKLLEKVEEELKKLCEEHAECKEIVDEAEDILNEIKSSLLDAYKRGHGAMPRHEELSKALLKVVLSRLGLGAERARLLDKAIEQADSIVASERGLGPLYSNLSPEARRRLFDQYLTNTFGSSVRFVPMASPLWVLLLTSYVSDVRIGKGLTKDLVNEVKASWLGRYLEELRKCSDEDSCRKVLDGISKEIKNLLVDGGEKLWFPVRPLSWFDAVNGNAVELQSFQEAMNRNSYDRVAIELIRDLIIALAMYSKLPRDLNVYGFEETLADILRRCTLFVPAAVFGAIAPDTSLYSHSRVTAAIAMALSHSGSSYGLVKIDLGGIQKFVSRVAGYKLASKAMRGRSALISLVQRAVLNYVAKLFDTCEICSITRESGVLTLIVPDTDIEKRIEKLEKVLSNTSLLDFHADLSFAIAYERGVTASNLFFGGDFSLVLERLDKRLNISKSRRWSRIVKDFIKARCREDRVRIDALSSEMVCVDASNPISRVERALGLEITSDVMGSRDLATMAPEAFSEGDYVSSITHRAIALGSAMRNAVLVIELYTYRIGEDGLPEPDESAVIELLNSFRKAASFDPRLLFHRDRERGLDIALIPIPTLGALFVVYSDHRSSALFKDEKALKAVIMNALRIALKHLKQSLGSLSDSLVKHRVELWVKIVVLNVPELISLLIASSHRDIKDVVITASNALKRLTIGFRFANTYLPSERISEDLWGPKTIEKSCNVLAVAKVDGDKVGAVVNLLAVSPSKLATLSDLIDYAFSCLAMASIYREAKSGRERDIYVQYCGGDDTVYLGPILDVLWLTKTLHRIVERVLYPLALSVGIWIADVKVPIAEIYELVVKTLERAKENGGKALALPKNISPAILIDGRVLDALPISDVERLEKAVEMHEVLKSFGTLMYNLMSFSNAFADTLLKERGAQKLSLDLARLCVSYAYLWARRENELNSLVAKMRPSLDIPRMPGISCLELAKHMARLRPALALAHLYALDRALPRS